MYPPIEKSPALTATAGLHHGFFGRQGGVSDGDFATLNASLAVGDDRANVDENIRRAVMALKSGPVSVSLVKQVHGTKVHVATGPAENGHRPEADAIVTDRTGLALGILTADCAPVIFADPQAGLVAIAHAGWRGAVSGIIARTIETMTGMGARPERMIAAIGPTIGPANYEVGPDFVGTLEREHSEAMAFVVPRPGERPLFDLPGLVRARIAELGIGTLESIGGDTYADPERYFSHRWGTHHDVRTGRQIALVVRG